MVLKTNTLFKSKNYGTYIRKKKDKYRLCVFSFLPLFFLFLSFLSFLSFFLFPFLSLFSFFPPFSLSFSFLLAFSSLSQAYFFFSLFCSLKYPTCNRNCQPFFSCFSWAFIAKWKVRKHACQEVGSMVSYRLVDEQAGHASMMGEGSRLVLAARRRAQVRGVRCRCR